MSEAVPQGKAHPAVIGVLFSSDGKPNHEEMLADGESAAIPSSEALPRQPLMREADIVAALQERLARERNCVNSENPDGR